MIYRDFTKRRIEQVLDRTDSWYFLDEELQRLDSIQDKKDFRRSHLNKHFQPLKILKQAEIALKAA